MKRMQFRRHASIAALSFGAAALLASLAVCCADTLYVSNWSGNTIEEFTADGVGSVFASAELSNPNGLAFDSTGNLYVANGDSTIKKFTTAGVGSVFASIGSGGQRGLAFDTAGNLYFANFNNNTIEKFTTAGDGSVFASTGLNNPAGLAFDSAGNLYAANYGNNTIQKFTMAGVGSRFANTGLSFPSFIAMRPNLVVPVYLSVRQSGSELILSWPTNAAGFTLQSTLNVTPPSSWIDSTDQVATVGAQFTVTNAISGGARFYRLKR